MMKLITKNRTMRRLAKGLGAIFAIKLLLLFGAMIFHSCESDEAEYENFQRQEALSKFEALVKETTPRISGIVRDHVTGLPNDVLLNAKSNRQLEHKARRIMKPLVEETKELLLTYNVTEDEVTKEFEDPNDPRIALVGLFLLAAENNQKKEVAVNFAQAFGAFSFAQTNELTEAKPDWVDCMITAVGIDVAVEFLKGNVTEAIAKKAIRKVASRVLGALGAAIAAYEFASCMGWF
ncbi:MAG: hypothetical protein HKM92_14255 [Arenibacter sp.]|nr:hypothetical protein [Arenibacter sp.]